MSAPDPGRRGEKVSLPRVCCSDYGDVSIGHHRLAARGSWGYKIERVVASVRKRTPDEWWRRAAEVDEAQGVAPECIGPLVGGLEFFLDYADESALLIPYEVREQITADAVEAAREVLIDGIDAGVRQMVPAVSALALFGRSDG